MTVLHTITRRAIVTICLMVVSTVLAGCSASYRGGISESVEKGRQAEQEKVRAEAYLFDAKLRRNGKVNSFRLDLYQTDTVIAMRGRGYLGKHVLSARLTSDSLTAYFPTSNEYIDDSISELLRPFGCFGELPRLNMVPYFAGLPDSVPSVSEDLMVVSNYEDPERPAFIVYMDTCAWRLDLIYELRDDGWRVREFSFTDGEDNWLTAVRRDFRSGAGIKTERFFPVIPPDAVRIIP